MFKRPHKDKSRQGVGSNSPATAATDPAHLSPSVVSPCPAGESSNSSGLSHSSTTAGHANPGDLGQTAPAPLSSLGNGRGPANLSLAERQALDVQLALAHNDPRAELSADDCLRFQAAAERRGDAARARAYEVAAERRFNQRKRVGL